MHALREPVDWQPVWNDRGSDHEQDYNCWIPVGPWPPGFVALGVYCRRSAPIVSVHALREPVDWQPVWNDRGSDNEQDYNCWIPVGPWPPGFVALGVYCRFLVNDQGPPSKDEATGLVVVHNSLAEECNFVIPDVWSDHGCTATYDLTLGQLPDKAL